MKILFISKYGDGMDIAFRTALDGNRVKLWIEHPKYKSVGDGIVPKTQNWRQELGWADLVVFDGNKHPDIWEQVYRKVPCFGGSAFGYKLEQDRGFAHKLMSRCGLQGIESLSFKTLPEALKHLKTHIGVCHVVKPQGPKVESYHLIVGEDADNSDAIARVELLIESGVPVESVEVEERKFGVEVGIAGFFNGSDWVGPHEINFEHKHVQDREIGYLTGEMGTLMRYLEDDSLPIWKETLGRFTSTLRAADYRGQLDLNMICDKDGFWPLEFTARLGYPACFLNDELHVTTWAELLSKVASGVDFDFRVRYDWAVGVVLAGFGFPFEDKSEVSGGLPITGLNERSLEHIHPMQVRMGKRGFEVAPGDGHLLVATGRGKRIHDAKDAAYSALRGIRVPNAFHRWDIGDKVSPYELERLGIIPVEESVA